VPEVDAVIGTGEVERIMEAVQGELSRAPRAAPAFLYHDLTPRIVTTPKHAAVHQNRGRLRSSLHVLHHSAASRRVSQPAIRIGDTRGGEN